jgi:hypothetical protein
MNTISQLITALFSQQTMPTHACSLLERAATARGLSVNEATQLRSNAMALLSVVR